MPEQPLGALSQRDDFRPGLKLVEVIRPLLYHLAPLGKMRRAVVGAPGRIAHGVGKLMLNVIGAYPQHFIEDGSRHSAEAVPAHLFLPDAHAPHGGENRVIAHRSCVVVRTRKDKAPKPQSRLSTLSAGLNHEKAIKRPAAHTKCSIKKK
jgi:hypothetical protein